MPPWHIERNIGIQKFKDDPSLTDAEIATIAAWVDQGAPKGNMADMPAPRMFRRRRHLAHRQARPDRRDPAAACRARGRPRTLDRLHLRQRPDGRSVRAGGRDQAGPGRPRGDASPADLPAFRMSTENEKLIGQDDVAARRRPRCS